MKKDISSRNELGRRDFLKFTGMSLLATSVPVGSAIAEPDDSNLPIHAQGKTIHRYKPDGDVFQHEEQFISTDLKPLYGSPVIKFDAGPIPREEIPDEYKDPDRPFLVQVPEVAVIGTFEQHYEAEQREAEQQLLAESSGEGEISTQRSIRLPFYGGPRYVYTSGKAARNRTVAKRESPINLAWRGSVRKNADQIRGYMRNRGWRTCCAIYSHPRYILNRGRPEPQDAHIYDGIRFTAQWHIRVWNVSVNDLMNTKVVGSAHRDPWNHNQVFREAPWYFDKARNRALGNWRNWGYRTGTTQIGNGGKFPTSNGRLGHIRR